MGRLDVRDELAPSSKREELEEFAGAGYGVPEAEYERLIGQLR